MVVQILQDLLVIDTVLVALVCHLVELEVHMLDIFCQRIQFFESAVLIAADICRVEAVCRALDQGSELGIHAVLCLEVELEEVRSGCKDFIRILDNIGVEIAHNSRDIVSHDAGRSLHVKACVRYDADVRGIQAQHLFDVLVSLSDAKAQAGVDLNVEGYVVLDRGLKAGLDDPGGDHGYETDSLEAETVCHDDLLFDQGDALALCEFPVLEHVGVEKYVVAGKADAIFLYQRVPHLISLLCRFRRPVEHLVGQKLDAVRAEALHKCDDLFQIHLSL